MTEQKSIERYQALQAQRNDLIDEMRLYQDRIRREIRKVEAAAARIRVAWWDDQPIVELACVPSGCRKDRSEEFKLARLARGSIVCVSALYPDSGMYVTPRGVTGNIYRSVTMPDPLPDLPVMPHWSSMHGMSGTP